MNRFIKKFGKKVVTILTLGAVLLTGCAGADTSSGEANVSSGAASAVQSTESDEEVVVTYAQSTLWETYNFLATTSTPTLVVIEQVFDRLLVINRDGSYSERLADSWSVDGKKVVFHINENAYWHDGEPVTAEDVVYTYQLKTNKEPGWLSGSSVYIEGTDDEGYELSENSVAVVALDDKTVEVTLKQERDPSVVLSALNTFVLPKHLLSQYTDTEVASADFWKAPIGSGPFKYDSEIDGERVEFVKNENYYLGAPNIDRLVVRFMAASTLAAGLLNGEVDVTSDVSLSDIDLLQSSDNVTVESVTSTQYQTLVINLENDVFTANVRNAINAAINKQALVDELLKGYGEAAVTFFPSFNPYFNEAFADTSTYDPELAKQLLEEENWDSSIVYNLTVPKGNEARERSALLIQQDLAAVGIQTEIVTYDFATALQNMRDNKYDLLLMGAAGGLEPSLSIGSISYFSHTTDEKFAELTSRGAAGLSFEERKPVYDEYQNYFVEQTPLVFLYFSDRIVSYNNRVKNLPITSADFWNNMLAWTWEIENE